MSNNPYKPPSALTDAAESLGTVVLECRDRSQKERIEAMDQGPTSTFVVRLWPIAALCGALGFAFQRSVASRSPEAIWVILGVVFAGICGRLYWNYIQRPEKPTLVLHEQGFRFGESIVRFDELQTIRLGHQPSRTESALTAAGQVSAVLNLNPIQGKFVALAESTRDASATLVSKSGKTTVLNGMLVIPLPEDLKRFLNQIRSTHPDLVQGSAPGEQSTGWLDDRPFRMTQV